MLFQAVVIIFPISIFFKISSKWLKVHLKDMLQHDETDTLEQIGGETKLTTQQSGHAIHQRSSQPS